MAYMQDWIVVDYAEQKFFVTCHKCGDVRRMWKAAPLLVANLKHSVENWRYLEGKLRNVLHWFVGFDWRLGDDGKADDYRGSIV